MPRHRVSRLRRTGDTLLEARDLAVPFAGFPHLLPFLDSRLDCRDRLAVVLGHDAAHAISFLDLVVLARGASR